MDDRLNPSYYIEISSMEPLKMVRFNLNHQAGTYPYSSNPANKSYAVAGI